MSIEQRSQQQPHLVSLVLQSKKALQHGEHLCSKAHAQSSASAQSAVDILALDARVKWLSAAVVEQLKMASTIAKCIEDKRTHLRRQVESWDALRVKHSDALDKVLDALGAQIVPSDFHQTSANSSIFGSQHSDSVVEDAVQSDRKPEKDNGISLSPILNGHSVMTVGRSSPVDRKKRVEDRSRWKTLRDFVDDRAIEDALETIDAERVALDDLLGQTDQYPETLKGTIESIRNSIPTDIFSGASKSDSRFIPKSISTSTSSERASAVPITQSCLASQDAMKGSMAVRLEDLTGHYEQMANALHESETGPESDVFSEEDIEDMNRDTEELPAIIGELEESLRVIELNHNNLQSILENLKKNMEDLSRVLDDLDELGEIISEMLHTQETVEAKCEEDLNGLHQHLVTLEQLHDRYVSYQTAYNKLLLEMARRRQYREALDHIVRGMAKQLEDMTSEESKVRSLFNSEYGAHLPEDICLCIGNMPTRWQVIPWEEDTLESLPEIADDLIAEAKEKVGFTDAVGAESL
ncbi:hypothetical protein AX17_007367 [Amanita inopinata Kibby_2008]|nr:hypothetical protein AX17_007367 [Amanita inopinata Kibby_2008]